MSGLYFAALAILVVFGFYWGRSRAAGLQQPLPSGGRVHVHSLPAYHGLLASIAVVVPMLIAYCIGSFIVAKLAHNNALSHFPPDVIANELKRSVAIREILQATVSDTSASDAARRGAEAMTSTWRTGNMIVFVAGVLAALAGMSFVISRIGVSFRARNHFERVVQIVLLLSAAVAVLTTIGIVLSVLTETYRFFFDPSLKGRPTVTDFLFGTEWNPQAALRADQGEIKTAYGILPLLAGTLLITFIAMIVAGPIGLFSAIYLSEYASHKTRAVIKPLLEILAGIPTVVLGFFAALSVAPLIRGWGESLGLDVASESALAAGLVMGMMIIPFISSLSDDVMHAVPQSLRDGAYGLGATKSETIKRVVLPAALPGIVSAFMLAISRAIGETMIVVMAAGLAGNLTFNPLSAVTTFTVQIKTILVGDQEFDSAKTLAAFALGFVLFFITLVLNVIALRIVRKYREQYD